MTKLNMWMPASSIARSCAPVSYGSVPAPSFVSPKPENLNKIVDKGVDKVQRSASGLVVRDTEAGKLKFPNL